MVNVFDDFRYAMQYEQVNLDLDNTYNQSAKESIDLAKPIRPSLVLDLGCGTGVSTYELFNSFSGINVVGLDKSGPFIEMASFKFNKLGSLESLLQKIRDNNPYPKILRDNCDVLDLETHLKSVVDKSGKFRENVSFYVKDASEISSLQEKSFDYVLANQFIHWLRKKDAKQDEPNLDYEKNVLQQVRDKLKQEGKFSFNMSGADFEFDNPSINEMHLLNHPFYSEFTKALYSQLGLEQPAKRVYTFNHAEVERIMEENGFNIEKTKHKIINRTPKMLLEVCLIGGHMQAFQKMNIDSTMQEREKVLEESLSYASKKSSPNSKPVIETGIHYLVRKA